MLLETFFSPDSSSPAPFPESTISGFAWLFRWLSEATSEVGKAWCYRLLFLLFLDITRGGFSFALSTGSSLWFSSLETTGLSPCQSKQRTCNYPWCPADLPAGRGVLPALTCRPFLLGFTQVSSSPEPQSARKVVVCQLTGGPPMGVWDGPQTSGGD